MSANVELAEEPKPVGAHPRVVALLSLSAMVGALVVVGRAVYFAYADSWVAPTTLSADDDRVIETNAKLSEQQLVREKMRTDIERIDVDLHGIDAAITRLNGVRETGRESLRWTAFMTSSQADAARQRSRSLDEQQKLLVAMIARQEMITGDAKVNAAAGLLSRHDIEREEQALDQLRLSLAANRREAMETTMQNAQFTATANVLRDNLKDGGAGATAVGPNGTLPEIVAGQDHAASIELELIKLESTKRSLETQRAMAVDSIRRIDELFKQLRGRPVYRAAEAKTDVAFIPYSQLRGVESGSKLVTCAWTLFRCRDVGRIAEVLPGEVTAQDPWGTLARGQYAILDLADHEAAKEKVLRVRPSSAAAPQPPAIVGLRHTSE